MSINTISADYDGGEPDERINLTELLRVIQFYNMQAYHCASDDEFSDEGYAPGPGDHACIPHSSDYYNPDTGSKQDWNINISELLRLIQLYNMGGYYWCPRHTPPTEDGFCPLHVVHPEGELEEGEQPEGEAPEGEALRR